MSQWADANRRLSSEASFEPGRWRTSRAAYQRGILDACSDPAIQDVVVMSSAQVGKSEIILNTVGYFAHYNAAPMLLVQPTIEMGEAFSKDRVAPMIRDTPPLKSVFGGAKSRNSANTVLHKTFPGGHLTIAGANSPKTLAGRPIRILLFDEVDRAPMSAGTEGDPVSLAEKRTNNFPNRKRIKVSTPTIKGFSRIEQAYLEGDQRQFFIPCPACGESHVLRWGNVIWPKDEPEKAEFKCPHCQRTYNDAAKNDAVKHAEEKGFGWKASVPFRGVASFHINELYSPWRRLAEIVADFLKAKDFPERLQVWINTSLGETWEEGGEALNEHELQERCEKYAAKIPARVLAVTFGADTQPDRIEAELIGWGSGEESWSIDYQVFYGDPDIAEGDPGSPWDAFTDWRRKHWKHETVGDLQAWGGCIDSGGHNTQAVYDYTRRLKAERCFAVKGVAGQDRQIVSSAQKKRTGKMHRPVDVFLVGVDQVKDMVYRRLKVKDQGAPGYCHFPQGRSVEYFRQLTAEKKVLERDAKGFNKRVWKLPEGRRNEALDCRVYGVAALHIMRPDWQKLGLRMKKLREELTKQQATASAPVPDPEELTEESYPAPTRAKPEAETAQDAERERQHTRAEQRRMLRRRRSRFGFSWR